MLTKIKEGWRCSDTKIDWPLSSWPDVSTPFGFWKFRAWGLSVSLTQAWGRPHIWIGPVFVIF